MPTYFIVVVYGSREGMVKLYEDVWLPNWCDYTLDGDMQFTSEHLPLIKAQHD